MTEPNAPAAPRRDPAAAQSGAGDPATADYGLSEQTFALEEDDPPFRWSEYAPEDYLALIVFWMLAVDVFAQFFSRFVLGDSIGWTEEMARYLLIATGFLGGAMAVRRNTHIMMEFLYSYLSPSLGRLLESFVDVVRLAFFAWLAWLTYSLAARTNSYMAAVDIPKSVVYYIAAFGFLLMALRALQRIVQIWPQRFSAARRAEAENRTAEDRPTGGEEAAR